MTLTVDKALALLAALWREVATRSTRANHDWGIALLMYALWASSLMLESVYDMDLELWIYKSRSVDLDVVHRACVESGLQCRPAFE